MFLTMYLAAILCFIGLVILMKYHWSRRRLYLLASQLSGPTAWPIVGNGLSYFCKPEDRLNAILKTTTPYSSPLRLWLGPKLIIFVKHPDHIQAILSSNKISTKDSIYRFLEPFLGQGLLTSAGTYHKNSRKMMQPLFSPKVLEGYSHKFQKHADLLVEKLREFVNGSNFNVLSYLHDSVFETTMDILVEDSNEHSVDYKDIPTIIRRFYGIFINRVTKFWLHPDVIYQRTKQYQEQRDMMKTVTTMTQEITDTIAPKIMKKLEAHKNEEHGDTTKERFSTMLEMMIEMALNNPGSLTEQELKYHMITFVATSQDTQSSVIAFTLMMLGMHPEIQDKVVEELKTILSDGHNKLEYSDLGKLKYMDMCIKETMRLFAVGPFILRTTEDDFKLDKWTIPAGCTVVVGIYNVHRSSEFWEKPEEFYPEHFLSDAVLNRHPYAFVPFSAGPRRCIAQQFSYIYEKIVIGTILQHFVVEADGKPSDIKLTTDVSIRPIEGHLIKLKERIWDSI